MRGHGSSFTAASPKTSSPASPLLHCGVFSDALVLPAGVEDDAAPRSQWEAQGGVSTNPIALGGGLSSIAATQACSWRTAIQGQRGPMACGHYQKRGVWEARLTSTKKGPRNRAHIFGGGCGGRPSSAILEVSPTSSFLLSLSSVIFWVSRSFVLSAFPASNWLLMYRCLPMWAHVRKRSEVLARRGAPGSATVSHQMSAQTSGCRR